MNTQTIIIMAVIVIFAVAFIELVINLKSRKANKVRDRLPELSSEYIDYTVMMRDTHRVRDLDQL